MLRTNFNAVELPIYEDAITEYGRKTGSSRLSVIKIAHDVRGRIVPGAYSLHDNSSADLSEFWSIFDSIKRNKEHVNTDLLNTLIEIQEYINKMGVVSMAMQNIKNKCKSAIEKATE